MQFQAEHTFVLFPGRTLTLLVFQHLKNAAQLLQQLLIGELELAFMNIELVIEPFQVLVAANKALHAQQQSSMKTRNIHSELVLTLSANTNIKTSLKNFGLSQQSESTLVGIFDATPTRLAEVKNLVQGEVVFDVPNYLLQHFNKDLAKKLYKITDAELNLGMSKAIVNRISTSDV